MAQILQSKKKPKARLYYFNHKDEMMYNSIKIKDISHMCVKETIY